MINYLQDEPEVLYKGCNEIIAANGKQTKAQIYLFRFNSAVSLYKSGILDAEQVIDDYESTMAALEQMTSSEALEKTKADIENIFITSNVASCDNLIALFTPRFEADPENLDLVSKIVNMMSSTEGCMDNDLFLSAISKKSELDPSYKTSYILYKLYSSRNEFDAAVSSLEKAIAFEESDLATDADYYYELATQTGTTFRHCGFGFQTPAPQRINRGEIETLAHVQRFPVQALSNACAHPRRFSREDREGGSRDCA